jgi:hypothetical protein
MALHDGYDFNPDLLEDECDVRLIHSDLGAIDMWWILGIAAAIAFSFMGREGRTTAIGGGFTIGLIVGVVLALIYGDWWLVGRSVTVGILIGLVAETLPKLLTRQR